MPPAVIAAVAGAAASTIFSQVFAPSQSQAQQVPQAPEIPTATTMPDPMALEKQAEKKTAIAASRRQGYAASILSQDNNETLGG